MLLPLEALQVSSPAMFRRLLLLVPAVGCVRVDDSDFASRVDVDGDGDRAAAYGGGDCDDADPSVNSNAVEQCNGLDDDCDGLVDNTADALPIWADADGDGFGDPDAASSTCAGLPDGFVENADDCDDTDPAVRPGAIEDCNGIDDDCDPETSDPLPVDWFLDEDGDGFGTDASVVNACLPPGSSYVLDGGDCDDSTGLASPGNESEVCNDGYDNDCDGSHDGCGWSGTHELVDIGRMLIGTDAGAGVGGAVAATQGLTDAATTLVIGAPSDSGGDGAVYLVDGPIVAGSSQRLVDRASIRLEGRDVAADGGDADPAAGAALSVGDATGDGITDLLIGAPGPGGGLGGAWLLAGPITGDLALTPSAATLWVPGPAASSGGTAGEAGRALGMGDVDGDGSTELLIAAPGLGTLSEPSVGSVFIVPGTETGTARPADFTRIDGRAAGGLLGARLEVVDWDGDGVDDILLGAPALTSGGAVAAGELALVLGPVDADLDVADADVRLESGAYGDLLGAGIAVVGDVTGDGGTDVIAAAPGRFSQAGAAWLLDAVPGSNGRIWEAASTRIDGAVEGDLLGAGVSAAGDVDRDGVDDLLIGAPGDAGAGRAYLLHGPLPSGNLAPDALGSRFDGSEAGDQAGLVLGGGIDLDLDSTPDMVFGVPGLSASGGASGGGAVIVVAGDGF